MTFTACVQNQGQGQVTLLLLTFMATIFSDVTNQFIDMI